MDLTGVVVVTPVLEAATLCVGIQQREQSLSRSDRLKHSIHAVPRTSPTFPYEPSSGMETH